MILRVEKNYRSEVSFLALLRAGLWEKEILFLPFGKVDYEEIKRLAKEQSVVGLISAGLEQVKDIIVPQEELLIINSSKLQVEKESKVVNEFVARLIQGLRNKDVYAILVNGQGIAQCYEKPLWRSSGDVDLFLSSNNYDKAKALLVPTASKVEEEYERSKHLVMTIDSFVVELHGTLQCNLSPRVKRGIEEIENDIIYGGQVRSWQNGSVQIFLPGPDGDAIYLFVHFLDRFYKEGIGLRQICDWCRLLWTYRNSIDEKKLERRIRKMGLVSEWKAFASLAVDYLGLPKDAMPLYETRFSVKGLRLLKFILVGYSGNKFKDTWQIVKIFPLHTIKFLPSIFLNVNGLKIKERLF